LLSEKNITLGWESGRRSGKEMAWKAKIKHGAWEKNKPIIEEGIKKKTEEEEKERTIGAKEGGWEGKNCLKGN